MFCLQKDCFNYIKLLLRLNDTHLYVCGTYAFSPTCTYIVSEPQCHFLFRSLSLSVTHTHTHKILLVWGISCLLSIYVECPQSYSVLSV